MQSWKNGAQIYKPMIAIFLIYNGAELEKLYTTSNKMIPNLVLGEGVVVGVGKRNKRHQIYLLIWD